MITILSIVQINIKYFNKTANVRNVYYVQSLNDWKVPVGSKEPDGVKKLSMGKGWTGRARLLLYFFSAAVWKLKVDHFIIGQV